jgi:hypothetical protein
MPAVAPAPSQRQFSAPETSHHDAPAAAPAPIPTAAQSTGIGTKIVRTKPEPKQFRQQLQQRFG